MFMMDDAILPWLTSLGSHPIAVAIAIFLATFILEDAATAGAALLAANGAIPDALALLALYSGIFLGDIGLYGLGYAARSQERVRLWIGQQRIERGRAWLDNRLIWALIGARFVPGLRLPTYTASGFLRVSFTRFAAVAACAAGVWTTGVFYLIKEFGAPILAMLGPWSVFAGVTILLAVLFASPMLEWLRARRRSR